MTNVPNEVKLPELQSLTLNGAAVGIINPANLFGSLDLNLQHRAIVRTENLQNSLSPESPVVSNAAPTSPVVPAPAEATTQQEPGSKAETPVADTTTPMLAVNVKNRQLRNMTEEALETLRRNNVPPHFFSRGGQLTQVVFDAKGRPVLRDFSADSLRGELSRSANYVERVVGKDGKPKLLNRLPPLSVVRDILALPPSMWEVPIIEAIIEVPCLRSDGSILSEPGYDAATGLYLQLQDGMQFDIPSNPTAEDLQNARELIEEVIEDFPFVDEPSKHNAIAGLLTPVCRPAIQGPTPLELIDATQMGTGKGLLADVGSMIVTGRPAALFSVPENEEEWRKQLTSIFAEGSTVVVFDNVERRLKSAQLSKALTAHFWKDRLLGLNKTGEFPVKCSWIATGNNIQLGGDVARRCYHVRMDAKCPKAYRRTEFRHPDLKVWVLENRRKLIHALLVMARAWFAAGCPAPTVQPIGSFESWTKIVGGILEFAGLKSFLGNGEALYDEADVESRQWEAFLLAAHDRFRDPFRAAEVLEASVTGETGYTVPLLELLPDSVAGPTETLRYRLGNAFSAQVGRRFGQSGVYLEKAGERQRATLWKVVVPDR